MAFSLFEQRRGPTSLVRCWLRKTNFLIHLNGEDTEVDGVPTFFFSVCWYIETHVTMQD